MAYPGSPTNGQIYKDKIYNSTVLAWQDYNAVAPVSSEPSLGTLHFRNRQVTNSLLTQVPVSGTWYTVTFTGYPVGTKAVVCYCQYQSITSAGMFWRPYNNGDTVAQSWSRAITANGNTAYSGAQTLVVPDSSGRVDFGVNGGSGSFQVNDWTFYYI